MMVFVLRLYSIKLFAGYLILRLDAAPLVDLMVFLINTSELPSRVGPSLPTVKHSVFQTVVRGPLVVHEWLQVVRENLAKNQL